MEWSLKGRLAGDGERGAGGGEDAGRRTKEDPYEDLNGGWDMQADKGMEDGNEEQDKEEGQEQEETGLGGLRPQNVRGGIR